MNVDYSEPTPIAVVVVEGRNNSSDRTSNDEEGNDDDGDRVDQEEAVTFTDSGCCHVARKYSPQGFQREVNSLESQQLQQHPKSLPPGTSSAVLEDNHDVVVVVDADEDVVDKSDDPKNHENTMQSSSSVSASLPDPSSKRSLLSSASWQRARERQDSLRIAVSDIAALIGYHPYKVLPELILQLVYQGWDGQALMQHDAEILGLELIESDVDEHERLRELAEKAGPATVAALNRALGVDDTTLLQPPQHVQEAAQRQRDVLLRQSRVGNYQVLNATSYRMVYDQPWPNNLAHVTNRTRLIGGNGLHNAKFINVIHKSWNGPLR